MLSCLEGLDAPAGAGSQARAGGGGRGRWLPGATRGTGSLREPPLEGAVTGCGAQRFLTYTASRGDS